MEYLFSVKFDIVYGHYFYDNESCDVFRVHSTGVFIYDKDDDKSLEKYTLYYVTTDVDISTYTFTTFDGRVFVCRVPDISNPVETDNIYGYIEGILLLKTIGKLEL